MSQAIFDAIELAFQACDFGHGFRTSDAQQRGQNTVVYDVTRGLHTPQMIAELMIVKTSDVAVEVSATMYLPLGAARDPKMTTSEKLYLEYCGADLSRTCGTSYTHDAENFVCVLKKREVSVLAAREDLFLGVQQTLAAMKEFCQIMGQETIEVPVPARFSTDADREFATRMLVTFVMKRLEEASSWRVWIDHDAEVGGIAPAELPKFVLKHEE